MIKMADTLIFGTKPGISHIDNNMKLVTTNQSGNVEHRTLVLVVRIDVFAGHLPTPWSLPNELVELEEGGQGECCPYPSFESVKALKSINTGKDGILRRHNNRQRRIRTQINTKPL